MLLEAFAIEVLKACSTIWGATELLGIASDAAQRIMERAVERGLERRELGSLEYAGMDEKSFGKGQGYISVLVDLSEGRVLEVSPGRTEESADQLWAALGNDQRAGIKAVAIDMWPASANSISKRAPRAEIVHDRFHISKHLNEAGDKVRREEHKALMRERDERLKGSKQLWLFNPENMTEERWLEFSRLKDLELKAARAWAIKEQFRWFWYYRYAGSAGKFFSK